MLHPVKFPRTSAARDRMLALREMAEIAAELDASRYALRFTRSTTLRDTTLYVVEFGGEENGLHKAQVEVAALGYAAGLISAGVPLGPRLRDLLDRVRAPFADDAEVPVWNT